MDGLLRLGGWVDEVAAALRLGAKAEYALRLCLEEAVANLVMHGVAPAHRDAASVGICVRADPQAVHVAIEDACAAFDPLAVAPPHVAARLEDARIGGVGIHLMRQFASDLRYEPGAATNRLILTIAR